MALLTASCKAQVPVVLRVSGSPASAAPRLEQLRRVGAIGWIAPVGSLDGAASGVMLVSALAGRLRRHRCSMPDGQWSGNPKMASQASDAATAADKRATWPIESAMAAGHHPQEVANPFQEHHFRVSYTSCQHGLNGRTLLMCQISQSLGIDHAVADCRLRQLVATHFTLNAQPARTPPHGRMKEQQDFNHTLHEVDRQVPAPQVRAARAR